MNYQQLLFNPLLYSDVEGVIKYLDYYIGKDKNSFLLVMERPVLYKDLFEIISDQVMIDDDYVMMIVFLRI